MKLKEFISNMIEKVRKSGERFIITLYFSLTLSIFASYLIIKEDGSEEGAYIWISLLAGTLISLRGKLADENMKKLSNLTNLVISSLMTVCVYILMRFFHDSEYCIMAVAGIFLLTLCFIMYCLYRGHDERKLFPHLVRYACFSGIITNVLLSGIVVSLMAFNYLIVDVEQYLEKIVPVLMVFIEFFMCYMLFISYLPEKDTEIKDSKAYNIIVSKAGLYVYLLLIAILYIYILKIIVTWTMPVGKLNWFGCIALLFYVFFYLNTDAETGKIQRWFVKDGGFLLLPIVGVQLLAIYIRVHAYGLTPLRYMSLLLIGIALLFVANSIIKKKISWVFAGAALIVVIGLISPLNIIDVPNFSQETRLKNVFRANGMLEGDEIIDYGKTVSQEDADRIVSGLDYFRYTDGKLDTFIENIKKLDRSVYTGEYNPFNDYEYFSYCRINDTVEIEGFRTIQMISSTMSDDEMKQYQNYFESLKGLNADLDNETMTYDVDENTRVVFNTIYLTYRNNELESAYVEYYLLRR